MVRNDMPGFRPRMTGSSLIDRSLFALSTMLQGQQHALSRISLNCQRSLLLTPPVTIFAPGGILVVFFSVATMMWSLRTSLALLPICPRNISTASRTLTNPKVSFIVMHPVQVMNTTTCATCTRRASTRQSFFSLNDGETDFGVSILMMCNRNKKSSLRLPGQEHRGLYRNRGVNLKDHLSWIHSSCLRLLLAAFNWIRKNYTNFWPHPRTYSGMITRLLIYQTSSDKPLMHAIPFNVFTGGSSQAKHRHPPPEWIADFDISDSRAFAVFAEQYSDDPSMPSQLQFLGWQCHQVLYESQAPHHMGTASALMPLKQKLSSGQDSGD